MGPSLYPRGQTTIETMETPRLTPAKEGKYCSITWEGYGLGFLGCRWYSADRLSPKRTNDQWYILCFTSDAITGKKLKLSTAESSLKVCCSIRTMLLFTSLSLPFLPFMIVALNCLSIHLIHLIWLHQTFICFQN